MLRNVVWFEWKFCVATSKRLGEIVPAMRFRLGGSEDLPNDLYCNVLLKCLVVVLFFS